MADRRSEAQPTAEEAASFEEALERLETIVGELEAGDLTLEESLARYEEGKRLSRRLTQTLDEAEKRVERLGAEGESGVAPALAPERGTTRPRAAGPTPEDGELPF